MSIETAWTILIVGSTILICVGFVFAFYILHLPTQPEPTPNDDTQTTPRPPSDDNDILDHHRPVYIIRDFPSYKRDITIRNCFNRDSITANHVVNTINKYNLQNRYVPLIITYSLLLCVYMDSLSKNCSNITTALNQLILVGGTPNSASGITELSYYTKVPTKPSKTTDFLVAAMDIISNHMASLVNEDVISEKDRRAIKGFNYEFCRNYLDTINMNCQP